MKTVLTTLALLCMAPAIYAGDRVAYADRDVVEYYVGSDGKTHVRTVTKSVMVAVADPVVAKAVPVVTAKATFQSGSYHSGHDCPVCGKETTRISNDAGPTHTHVCPYDGTVWYHNDAVSSRATLKIGWGRRGR